MAIVIVDPRIPPSILTAALAIMPLLLTLPIYCKAAIHNIVYARIAIAAIPLVIILAIVSRVNIIGRYCILLSDPMQGEISLNT